MIVNNVQGVYLLHFDPKYKHAGHYLGYADDIGKRVYEHEFDQSGCKLTSAAVRAGCTLTVARVWEGGDRTLERKLKGGPLPHQRSGSLARLCPICKAAKASQAKLVGKIEKGIPNEETVVNARTSLHVDLLHDGASHDHA